MGSSEERREHPRVACDLEATISYEGAPSPVATRCVDISRGGICVRGELELQLGTQVVLSVHAAWPGGQTDALELPGRIMWCSPVVGSQHQLGVMFTRGLPENVAGQLSVLLDLVAGRLQVPGAAAENEDSDA